MAVTTTARLGLTRWSAGSDPFTRAQMDASMAALEANAAMFLEGTLAGRPAAGKAGRLYRITDAAANAPTVTWDTGSAWVEIRPDLSSFATSASVTSGLAGKAATSHSHAAADVTSGVFAVARLGTGPTGSNFLRGDGVFAVPPADSVSTLTDTVITAVANRQVLLWNSGTSKWINAALATSDVTGLDTALSGKAASSHSHAIGDLPVATSGTSNATQLVRADDSRLSDARTPVAHNHVKADITDFAHSHAIGDLPVAASGTSNATQLVRADDSRLSNARTPTAHSHAIADLPVATSGTSNATQLVRADDSRLSNARTPTAHTHVRADITDFNTHTHVLTDLPDAWVKMSVLVATTANITLSGTQTIDGVAVAAGNRVLVKNQTTASQNGIYIVAAGAWTRSAAMNTAAECAGATVSVDRGTTQAGQIWTTTFQTTHTLGTTAMNWYKVYDSSTPLAPIASPTFTGTATTAGLNAHGTVEIGNANADLEYVTSMVIEDDTRNLTYTYASGKLSTIVEKDGSTTMRTTTLGYTGEKVTTITEVAGGKTVTTTLVYTGEDITSSTRTVA